MPANDGINALCKPPDCPGTTSSRADVFSEKLSFIKWAAALPRLLLAARTSFSRLLRASFCITFREGEPPPLTALFPLPVPLLGAFGREDPKGSSRGLRRSRRLEMMIDRVLHVAVMALNHIHCDGRAIPAAALRRPPSSVHCKVFARLRLLIEASARLPASFPLAAGRRGPHLLSRLDELCTYLKRCGISQQVYHSTVVPQEPVPRETSGPPALQPYREATAARLLITGRGHWDITPYLGPELLMPFREPSVLHGIPENALAYPDTSREDRAELLRVFALWDSLGLLDVHPLPTHPRALCRIFGSFKSPTQDRMIGDRRGPNSIEGRVKGVSHELPQGCLLALYHVKPGFALCGSSTDRSDYYHQIQVTASRSASNVVGPPFKLSELSHLCAHTQYLQRGVDLLGSDRNRVLGRHGSRAFDHKGPDPTVCGAFRSLFQGDHGGVEFATQAHEQLLRGRGLLDGAHRLVAGKPPPLGLRAEALVIDDYFCVSQTAAAPLQTLDPKGLSQVLRATQASVCIGRAKAAYASAGLAGSDHKDNWGSLSFTVAGAEVRSDLDFVEKGAVFVGAPAEKRLALGYISLKAAALPAVSEELVSSALGGWVSYIQFRRPFSCILDSLFSLASKEAAPDGSLLRALPRRAACELSLLAACAPILASNIAVPYDEHIYCTDASLSRGAACRARVGEPLSEALWQGAQSSVKGEASTGRSWKDPPADAQPEAPLARDRPLGMDYDFVELLSPTDSVSRAVASLGLRPGPLVSLASSAEFDLGRPWVLEWLLYLISRGRLRSLFVRFPGGTFSRAYRPPVRSPQTPEGPLPACARTRRENMLASRVLLLVDFCRRHGVPALMCSPRGSFVFSLPGFRALANKTGSLFYAQGAELLAGAGRDLTCVGCWLRPLPPGLVTSSSASPSSSNAASPEIPVQSLLRRPGSSLYL